MDGKIKLFGKTSRGLRFGKYPFKVRDSK